MKKINAPQKPLRSSWVSVPFTRSKGQGPTIKRSLLTKRGSIIKDRGVVIGFDGNHSNLY